MRNNGGKNRRRKREGKGNCVKQMKQRREVYRDAHVEREREKEHNDVSQEGSYAFEKLRNFAMESSLKRVPRTCWIASRRIVSGSVPHTCIIFAFVLMAYPRHARLERRREGTPFALLPPPSLARHRGVTIFARRVWDSLLNLWRIFPPYVTVRYFTILNFLLVSTSTKFPSHFSKIDCDVYRLKRELAVWDRLAARPNEQFFL